MQGTNRTSDLRRVALGWTHSQFGPSGPRQRQLSRIKYISTAIPSTEEETEAQRGPLYTVLGADPDL